MARSMSWAPSPILNTVIYNKQIDKIRSLRHYTSPNKVLCHSKIVSVKSRSLHEGSLQQVLTFDKVLIKYTMYIQ